MSGQPLILTLAGLALSVAGFAGLVGAFRANESWTRADLWRLHNIVRLSFVNMFLALAPVTVFRADGGRAAQHPSGQRVHRRRDRV